MLLLNVYNVHYNQPNSYTIPDSKISVPSWALRIQGKVFCPQLDAFTGLDTERPYIKMTHFIKRIEVAFDKDSNLPAIEWDRQNLEEEVTEHSGFEIAREGDKELEVTISLWINCTPRQFKVKKELHSLIGIRQCTRTQAVTALWQYIKANKLQDVNDRKIIHCNRELGRVMKKESMCFTEIMGKMKDWLEDVEPYRIAYKIK
eukprot:TRINITY_DN11356_c0_g1_i3.p1 TRINITY_DN11356_c0_g1~~TRINITY_DN11356_c0_g1_i3.p1  ORF type:complete len:203 (+),score=53.73 TRINITY_DN11356_c0_g1_i3:531-1139(+)